MFQCDQLIYIQMQKTGCTHIASILSKLFDGKKIGKHNAATPEQLASNRYFISSIRNPWDWYLSLWTFGVQGNGGLRYRLTNRDLRGCIKSIIKNQNRSYHALFLELTKDTNVWRSVYDRSDNIESFRRWLRLMNDPKNSHFLGEGYGDTAITDLCGFMTYRYLYLCCRNVEKMKEPGLVLDFKDIVQFDADNCYIDFFIKQESLEDDLCKAIEKVRPLTQNERDLIFGKGKKNTSKRSLLISDYYDKESIELIRSRDRLLIDKFDYSFPN
ncbi:MAG TPA: hypothetical protein ENJ28_00100 [Gammaproteobacteria bacterium]|nr:hypothetical protein [Gammaproteobacteria bacterium]